MEMSRQSKVLCGHCWSLFFVVTPHFEVEKKQEDLLKYDLSLSLFRSGNGF